jgi:hypothetical protein
VDSLQVNDVTPTWGYLKGNQKIVITGCGFTTYSEATCVWGNWHSTNAIIVNDNTIHCWTPKVSFITVPTTTSFNIIFDGTPAISRKLPDFWWGPMITAISPTQTYVAGGTPLTITGFGFSEYNGTSNVTIDGVPCASPSITDTSITCTLPAGSINQNAIVDVYFGGYKYYFVHTDPWTLHYGPIVTGVNPTCGHVLGGDTITITGSLFDDPVLNNPRVEFLIGGGWWYGSNAAHSGSTVTVQTPYPPNGLNLWDTTVSFTVFGGTPSFAKVPGTANFHYGALLFTVTPTVGYIDGGDVVTITGCAFRDYNSTTITGVFQGAGSTNLCNPTTINVVSDNIITCTSVASTTCFNTVPVQVGLPAGNRLPTPTQVASTYSNNWWWGPLLNVLSLTPTRGPWSVTATTTVTGYKIARSASTLFGSNLCNYNVPAVLASNGTVGNGQTTITCTVPTYAWNKENQVNYGFDAPCVTYPSATPKYHWGPLCTAVSPTFGYLGGGQTVTLTGAGFQDADWTGKTIKPTFCIPGRGAACNWEQYGAAVAISSTTTATTTTPNFNLAPRNGLGANRYFGDSATVNLFFDTVGQNETQVLTCGSYRYGPIVTATAPRKGPIGPRADHSPNTQVSVQGVGFADPLLTNNLRVAFGPIHGESATAGGDTTITVKTLWGARANTDKSVYVYFDTCNTTASTTAFTWGPQVFNITPIWGYNAGFTGGVNTVITIQGARFDEWLYNGYTDAVCVIDNVYGTNTVIVNPTTITCTVPTRPFGTQAAVQVVFGKTCRGDWDWSQVVQSPNDIFYRPIITGITPTVGWTSGAQTVTISGLGLGGWQNSICFFGHYVGALVTGPVARDDPVVCKTPVRRGDFNTDVLVHVQLLTDTTVTATTPNVGFDYKVWGPTYHYGPLCTNVNPSRGYLNPGALSVTLSGVGFADNIFFNVTTPIVYFNGANVTVTSPSDTSVVVSNIGTGACLTNKTITMWWDKTSQVISCPPFTHGPVVVSSQPTLGWSGDTVTITGDLFDDVLLEQQLSDVKVVFGSATGTTTSISRNIITAVAPVNAWLFDPVLVVRWQSSNQSCVNDAVLKANDFHYGPIILAINPTFGYVYGRQPVTITGLGFQCCGLNVTATACRFAHTEISPSQDGVTTTVSDTTVTCFSIGRGPPEITGSSNALANKTVGLRFNDTSLNRIIDTDTAGLPRQGLVTYYYGPLVTAVTPTFGRIRGDTVITITGAGFKDPFFNQATFLNPNPACSFTNPSTSAVYYYNSTSWQDTAIVCQTLPYIHKCGDPNDVVALVFYVNTSTTDRFITPTGALLTHHYGPLVASITPSWGYVKGGDSVTIAVSETDEWTGRLNQVLFANREVNGATYATSNQIVATTPRGSFLHTGPVSVILSFKNDALTTLKYWWHWTPFTTSISQAWGIENGGFSTTVYGGGFCEYELVQCSFGNTLGTQSDVAYDDRVVCSVPQNSPGTNAVSLTFCDYWDDCACSYAQSADTITAPSFTHVGITGVSPVSGPWVGNTIVTITGTGFDQFSAISVSFGSLTAVSPTGNSTSATSFTVITPASPTAQTVQIFVTLTYSFSTGETITYTIPGIAATPFNFFYGYPAITSIAPTTTDVDVGTDVTLTGTYFNGGVLSNIKCTFTVPAANSGTAPLTVNAKAKTDTTVTCSSPSYTTGVTLFGPTAVTVSFDGSRQSNLAQFLYSQTAAITSITPTNGPQYGATSVTIFGNNFNAGISILVKFGTVVTNIVSVSTNTGGTTTTTTTTGTTNTTTTGSTTGTTTGKNGTATVPSFGGRGARGVRGTNDQIVVYSPRSLANSFPTTAKVEVSLDGGLTWTNSATTIPNLFTYQQGFSTTSEVATAQATSATSMSNTLVPLVSLVFALVLFVVVF